MTESRSGKQAQTVFQIEQSVNCFLVTEAKVGRHVISYVEI